MRTNTFSKSCFFKALLELAEEKEYKDIQISEICARAGYNRSTFYRCYKDKEMVLMDGFKNMAAEFYASVASESNEHNDYAKNVEILFRNIRKNKEWFLLMHHARMDYSMYEVFRENFPLPEQIEQDRKYYLDFYSGGYIAIILDWLLSGMNETDIEMGKLIAQIILITNLS